MENLKNALPVIVGVSLFSVAATGNLLLMSTIAVSQLAYNKCKNLRKKK